MIQYNNTHHTQIFLVLERINKQTINNFVDGAYPYASDQYSSTEATEEDNCFSDADSYQAWDDDDGEQAFYLSIKRSINLFCFNQH